MLDAAPNTSAVLMTNMLNFSVHISVECAILPYGSFNNNRKTEATVESFKPETTL